MKMDRELAKLIHHSLLIVRGMSRAIENSWEAFGKKKGISPAHQHVLWLLWHKQELTMGKLAEMGLWHISTATRLVATVKKKGFIETKADDEDGRYVIVRLTERGRQLIENIFRDSINDPEFLPFIRYLWDTDPCFVKQSIERGFVLLEHMQSKQYVEMIKEIEPIHNGFNRPFL